MASHVTFHDYETPAHDHDARNAEIERLKAAIRAEHGEGGEFEFRRVNPPGSEQLSAEFSNRVRITYRL